MVRDWLQPLRVADPMSVRPTMLWKVPSGRHAARLVVADADELNTTENRFIDALITGSTVLARVIELARQFRRMVRQRRPDELDSWIAMAGSMAPKGFADGLQRDFAAVRAALSSRWSTSPVEGQISRLKTIKRQMHGRAGFDLLRHRVLTAA